MEILTPLEESQFKATKAHIIESARSESLKVRARYVASEVDDLVRTGIPPNRAERIIAARCKQVLSPDDVLKFDDGRVQTVRDVLASPETYDGTTMRDPLEPEAGLCKAKFYKNTDTNNPVIHSQLHGGLDYFLTSPINNVQSKRKWFSAALNLGSIERFIDSPPPSLDWIFEGSLLSRTTGMLVGPGGVGKSTLSLMMLMAVATGRDILPGIFTPTRSGKVLGVFGEDDEAILHHRIHSMVKELFCRDKEAQKRLCQNMRVITTAGRDVRFLVQATRTLKESEFFKEVINAVEEIEDLRLIVLDPVSRFHGAEENDNGAGTFLVSLMERIAQQTGAAVVILHHVTKRAGMVVSSFDLEAAMNQDAARGASGLTNGVRWQCNLFGLPEKEARKKLGIPSAGPGQYLAMKVAKKNYGKPEDIYFLQRGQGGMLSVVDSVMTQNAPELDVIIKDLLFDAILKAEGKQQTQRMILDGYSRTWKKDFSRITRKAIEQTIIACILRGELFERQGKNASGKTIVYLSPYPEPSADVESKIKPEINFRTVGEPEDFKLEKPQETGNSKSTVHNSLSSQDNTVPEEINRRMESLRSVCPQFCETVEPDIFFPYGEGLTSSGSHRETPVPITAEDQNAEIF